MTPGADADVAALTSRHRENGYSFAGFAAPEEAVPAELTLESTTATSLRSLNVSSSTESKDEFDDATPVSYETSGAWLMIDEDGAVYVKSDAQEVAAESLEQSITYESGNAHGCPGAPPSVRRPYPSTPVPMDAADYTGTNVPRRLAVIGNVDSRIRVSANDAHEFRHIGHFPTPGCSGTLVGPSHVITAAHCLWHRDSSAGSRSRNTQAGRWFGVNKFVIGRTDGANFINEANIVRRLVHRRYRSLSDYEFDWDFGMVELDYPLGKEVGWMGMRADCDYNSESNSKPLRVAGYPGDKQYGTLWHDTCGEIDYKCHDSFIIHKCDTYGGMSGSSMVEVPESRDEAPVVRAIHVAGTSQYNIATLIRPQLFQTLQTWKGGPASCPYTARETADNAAAESNQNSDRV
jgi:V8-like Glu-specific endopeptidase